MRLVSWGSSQPSGCLRPAFPSQGSLASQFPNTEESLLPHPSAPGPRPPSPPSPDVYLTLSCREHNGWMTSRRRQACQTGLPNRSPAPLLGLQAMTMAASSSAQEKEGHSPWVQPTPARTSSSPGPPCSSLSCMTFAQQNPQSPTCLPVFSCCTPSPPLPHAKLQVSVLCLQRLFIYLFFKYCFCFMVCFSGLEACGILVPRPGIKPTPPCIGRLLDHKGSHSTTFGVQTPSLLLLS